MNISQSISFPSSSLGMHTKHSNTEQVMSQSDVLLPSWSLGARLKNGNLRASRTGQTDWIDQSEVVTNG